MSKPTQIVFSKSPQKGKKYKVEFVLKGKKYIRHFGALGYEQYKDSTGLGLYTHLNHGDIERKKKYYQRHGLSSNPLSAKYWSNKYLW